MSAGAEVTPEKAPDLSSGAGRQALLLFLFLNFFFLLTSTGRLRVTDEYMTLFQTESLVERGSTAVPQAVRLNVFYGKFDRGKQPRAPYPPGQAVAAMPWYLAGAALNRVLGASGDLAFFVLGFAVALSSATFSAGAVALAFLLFRRMGVAARCALGAALVMALATPLFAYSGWFYSEPLSAMLLVGAALALFGRAAGEPVTLRAAAVAGVLLGLAVLVRPTHVLAAPVFLAAVLVREGRGAWRQAAALAAAVALGCIVILSYNAALFGHPLEFGYPESAEGGKRLNSFETPLLYGLAGFLFSPGKSIFLFAPPLALALYGLKRLWLRERGLAVAAGGTLLVYLLFYSTYTQWEGGYSFGPRYLVPALALASLALGPLAAEVGPQLRRALLVLFLAGVAVNALGLATSFLEDQAAPGHYYDRQWNYNLGHSPLWNQGELLWYHATSGAPAPLGLGMDRWFVFLRKGGVPAGALLALATAMLAGLLAAGYGLRRQMRGA